MLGAVRPVPSAFNGPFPSGQVGRGGKPVLDTLAVRAAAPPGVLVEYGPGGYSPGHTHPKSAFIYATMLEGAIRSQVNDGPVTTYEAGQSFSELPGDRHAVSANGQQDEAGQAPRGVRGGHERDGTDDPIRELTVIMISQWWVM